MSDTGVRIEANPKWIRGSHKGRMVVDSRRSQFVWEIPYYPQWYFPVDDIYAELVPNGTTFDTADRGVGTRYDIRLDGEVLADAAWRHLDAPDPTLRDLVRLEWGALDAWFEEDVEVFVHPRSPNVRVDVLPTSKHIRISIDGHVVAETRRARVLYETGLPPRYYIPKADVRMDLLTPTETTTACPYKGWASYWTVTVDGVDHADLAWGYRTPLPESVGIAGHVCFYNEKVDLEIDCAPIERPATHFA